MIKRRKQTFVSFFSCFIFFAFCSKEAESLPKESRVISGNAEFQEVDFQSIQIKTSDRAVLHYSQFDIGKTEKVTFIQPSKTSCVLNKVVGPHSSKILGQLKANGKVFLVNSQGIYFGPESQVNVGSLIASTLDISSEDFMSGNYRFRLGPHQKSLIQNEGFLSSTDEGSIVLMAPQIRNLGVIQASLGQVALLSGESVTLDFTGDGLVQFSVEGDLKNSLIEQRGSITAFEGSIFIQLNQAKKVIAEIVNQEGVEEGDLFIEEKGRIHLVSASSLLAKNISIQGDEVVVEGVIDSSDLEKKGGSVHIFGDKVSLHEATIDVSGALGGGEVLIGGEFQGKGTTPYSRQVVMDFSSQIKADALEKGEGGFVVLWSEDQTIFNGRIFARGGNLGGSGGVVETSSLGQLQITTGYVNNWSLFGNVGRWLIDPAELIISNSSTTCSSDISTSPVYGSCCNTFDCPSCSINISTINASTVSSSPSNVTLQASSLISVLDEISMSNPGVGLTFLGCVDANPVLQLSANITTKGGAFIVSSDLNIELMNDILVDTTNGGDLSYLTGADVTMEGLFSLDSNVSGLQINAGTGGVVTLSSSLIGSATDVSYVTVQNAAEVFVSQLVTQGDLGFSMPTGISLSVTGDFASIDTTGGGVFPLGAPITTGTIDGTTLGEQMLTLNAGSGLLQIGAIGGNTPLGDVTILGAANFSPPNITTADGKISIYPPIVLSSSVTFDTTDGGNSLGSDIHLLSKVDGTAPGNENFTLTAGAGSIHLDQPIGSLTRIGNLTVTSVFNMTTNSLLASAIVQMEGSGVTLFGGGVVTTAFGGLDLTGDSFIFGGAVRAEGVGGVQIVNTGPLIISKKSDMTLGGSFSQSGGGEVLMGGNLTLSSLAASVHFTDPLILTNSVALQTNNGEFLFGSRIIGPGSLTVNAGSSDVTFQGSGGFLTSLGAIDVTASHVFIRGVLMKTSGNQSYHAQVQVVGNAQFSSLSGDITFDSFLDGFVSGSSLIFSMGGGNLTFNQLGSIEPLGTMSVFNSGTFSAQSITGTSLEIVGGESTVQFLGPMNLSGELGLLVDAKEIILGAPIVSSRVFFRAADSILNRGSSELITILGSSLLNVDYFNALGGSIGSLESPIEVSTSELLRIGAFGNAYFSGPSPTIPFQYISANVPCIMMYNELVLRNCHEIFSTHDLFNTLPKDLFYVPGLYASWSWDNLSNDWYFYPEALNPENSRATSSLFALKQEKQISKFNRLKNPKNPSVEKVSVPLRKKLN